MKKDRYVVSLLTGERGGKSGRAKRIAIAA